MDDGGIDGRYVRSFRTRGVSRRPFQARSSSRTGQTGVAVLGGFTYTARAAGLAPGDETFRVRHDFPGTERDPPAQEFQVTVR